MVEIDIIRDRVKTFSRVLQEIPEIRYVGDPILRVPTVPATFAEGIEIGKELGEVILRYRKIAGYGRGFAAPQIGISKSVFTTFVDGQIETFINPRVVKISETLNYYKELCLSSGIYYADIGRPDWIEMEWTDSQNKLQTKKFIDFSARLYQHEEKHLRGVLNLDECGPGRIGIATFDPLKERLRASR